MKALCRFEGHRCFVDALAISPDGKLVLSGGEDGTLRLWNLSSGKEMSRLGNQDGRVLRAIFSPDGKHVLAASGRTIRLWLVATGKELGRYEGPTGLVEALAFAPDGRHRHG